MKRVINIGNRKQACKDLEPFRSKHYEACDIEFTNVSLTKINDLVGFRLFRKSGLFVRSSTLWEIMQPVGQGGKHHHHGLQPNEIVDALASLIDSILIYKSHSNRYAVLVSGKANHPVLMVVIELHASLENNRNADINKLVTIYPKDNLNKLGSSLLEKEVLYKK